MNIHNTVFHKALFCFVVLLLAKSPLSAQSIVAEIPSKYDVSSKGAFEYSLPVRVPPGIKNMVPNLAINYSSQSGDGMLGVGWSLSGLSVITRGMPTVFHNGYIKPINFQDDVYFLDGQRLFETTPGTYLTEVKNFAKIKSYGATGVSSPAYFIVEYPNGLTYEYGNSISSKMITQGSNEVLIWSLNEIHDKNGNFITFHYDNPPNGQYRIREILYGNNSFADNDVQRIVFEYTNRDDQNKQWISGSEVLSNDVIESIKIFSGDVTVDIVNQYDFTYSFYKRTRLTKIEEIRNQTVDLPPIEIDWGVQPDPLELSLTTNQHDPNFTPNTGDFDGDGFTDYAEICNTNTWQSRVWLNDKDGDLDANSFTQFSIPVTQAGLLSLSSIPPYNRMIFDYDGDGLDDVIVIDYNNTGSSIKQFRIILLRANGTSSVFDSPDLLYVGQNSSSNNTFFNSNVRIAPGDFDGDGKMELIIAQPVTFVSPNQVNDYRIWLVGHEYSTLSNPVMISARLGHIDGMLTIDHNGDGKNEYVLNQKVSTGGSGQIPSSFIFELDVTYNSSGQPSLVWNNGYPVKPYNVTTFPNSNYKNWMGDFNGDGKTDFLSWDAVHFNEWYIAYSDGTEEPYKNVGMISLINPSSPLNFLSSNPTGNPIPYSIQIADFNGDGLDDILELISTGDITSSYKIFYSTGSSFYMETGDVDISAKGETINIGDANGDGQADLISAYYKWQVPYKTRFLSFYPKSDFLKVKSIHHAGKDLNVDYLNITHDPDYSELFNLNTAYIAHTFPVKVVKTLSDNVSTYNTYTYSGSLVHRYGLGFRGFEEIKVENINGKRVYNIYDLYTQVPYLKEKTTYDALDADQPFGIKSTFRQLDINGGANGSSRIVLTDQITTKDYINGQETIVTLTPGNTAPGLTYYEFGQIASKETVRLNMLGVQNGHEIETYTYDNNALFINRAKPISITNYSEIGFGGYSITKTIDYVYFNANGLLASETINPSTANEKTIEYLYNTAGNIIKETLTATGIPYPTVTEYTYTADERFLASELNPEGYVTTYLYGSQHNAWGDVEKKIAPDLSETSYIYDDVNRIVKMTDYRGVEVNTTFDWATNSQHSTLSTQEQFAKEVETSGISGSRTIIYDIYGNVLRETMPSFDGSDDIYTDYLYNNENLLISEMGPYPSTNTSLANTTNYTHDPFNRVVSEQSGSSNININYAYHNGYLNKEVDDNNRMKTYIFWGDKLHKVFNNYENIEYSYHGNGEVREIVANGVTTSFDADNYGRIYNKNEPNTGTTTYEYNALDQIVKETYPTSYEYEYTYDKLGRVKTKKEVGQTPFYSYVYDNTNGLPTTGKLTQVLAPNGSNITYSYNNYGELEFRTQTDGSNVFTNTNTYDNYGRINTYTYPTGDEVTYDYNSYGFLENVSLTNSPSGLPQQGLFKILNKNHLNQLTEAYHGENGSVGIYKSERTYDILGLPETRTTENISASAYVNNMAYTFDQSKGNLTQRADNNRNLLEDFTYDNEYDRLTNVQYTLPGGVPPIPDLHMEYDNIGNIRKKNDVSNSGHDWKYSLYALTLVPEPQTTVGPPFQAYEIPQHNTQDVDYYPFKKVKTITEALKNKISYTYGPGDERIKAEYADISSGTPVAIKTKYYAENYEKVVDATTGDERHISYVWAGGEVVAILYHTTGTTPSSEIYYPLTDYLGSITHILDNQGSSNNGIIEERSFDAWGRARNVNNWQPLHYSTSLGWIVDRGYTGHEHVWSAISPTASHNNNIINMNGRLYDALVGRMYSPDPVVADATNSQDYNKYTYVRNNPLKYTDPNGETPVHAVAIIVAGVVGGAVNVYNKWENIGSVEQGAVYFFNGFTGGAVSVVNPMLGTSITTAANVVTDVSYGKVPELTTARDYGEYLSGEILNGMSVNLGGAIGNGVNNIIIANKASKTASVTVENYYATAIEREGQKVAVQQSSNASKIKDIATKISQKQKRHLAGTAKDGGGYLDNLNDAQKVLNAVHSGEATILGTTKNGHLVIKYTGVTGTNVNLGVGITGQPTNIFILKGTSAPSIVPTSPVWTP